MNDDKYQKQSLIENKKTKLSFLSCAVLENVQLTSQATAKLISNTTGRTIDLSKIGLGQRSTGGNVVLMPDGKIKPITLKTNGGTPIVLSVSGASGTTQSKLVFKEKTAQSYNLDLRAEILNDQTAAKPQTVAGQKVIVRRVSTPDQDEFAAAH